MNMMIWLVSQYYNRAYGVVKTQSALHATSGLRVQNCSRHSTQTATLIKSISKATQPLASLVHRRNVYLYVLSPLVFLPYGVALYCIYTCCGPNAVETGITAVFQCCIRVGGHPSQITVLHLCNYRSAPC